MNNVKKKYFQQIYLATVDGICTHMRTGPLAKGGSL